MLNGESDEPAVPPFHTPPCSSAPAFSRGKPAEPELSKGRRYIDRLAMEGRRQLIVALPEKLIQQIDEIKQSGRFRSRSDVLIHVIQRRRKPTRSFI